MACGWQSVERSSPRLVSSTGFKVLDSTSVAEIGIDHAGVILDYPGIADSVGTQRFMSGTNINSGCGLCRSADSASDGLPSFESHALDISVPDAFLGTAPCGGTNAPLSRDGICADCDHGGERQRNGKWQCPARDTNRSCIRIRDG